MGQEHESCCVTPGEEGQGLRREGELGWQESRLAGTLCGLGEPFAAGGEQGWLDSLVAARPREGSGGTQGQL